MDFAPDADNIIEEFRRQDAGADRKLYDRFYHALCYYAEGIVQQRQEAEDTVVESFIKLFGKRKDFQNMAQVRAFLYTSTRNACIDFLRKQKRREQSRLELAFLADQSALNDETDLVNAEVLAALFREIQHLPPQCGEVFNLLFFQQLSTEQAAEQLQISPKTVLNQKGKAIQLLRKAFLQKGLLSALAILVVLDHPLRLN